MKVYGGATRSVVEGRDGTPAFVLVLRNRRPIVNDVDTWFTAARLSVFTRQGSRLPPLRHMSPGPGELAERDRCSPSFRNEQPDMVAVC